MSKLLPAFFVICDGGRVSSASSAAAASLVILCAA